jgi:hypothetical protein
MMAVMEGRDGLFDTRTSNEWPLGTFDHISCQRRSIVLWNRVFFWKYAAGHFITREFPVHSS